MFKDRVDNYPLKVSLGGTGNMAEQLKRLLFQRIQVQFPKPTGQLTIISNFSFRVCPLWASGTYVVHRHTYREKHPHTQNILQYFTWRLSGALNVQGPRIKP